MTPRQECDCRLMHEHGTLRMYAAHACRCVRCRSANAAKAHACRNRLPQPGSSRWVDNTGSIRRLRALAAIGVPRLVIAQHLGVSERHIQAMRDGVHPKIRRDTAQRIADAYTALWDAPAHLRSANTRRQALARGYAPPLAWDDIDDPDEQPQGHVIYKPERVVHEAENRAKYRWDAQKTGDDIDEIAVERALAGERVSLSRAELAEAVDTLGDMGYSAKQVAARLGVAPRTVTRYRSRGAA